MPKGNTEGYPMFMGEQVDAKAMKLAEYDMENNSHGAKMMNKKFEMDNGMCTEIMDVTLNETGPQNLDVAGADSRGPM
jgi:hypothetical protein